MSEIMKKIKHAEMSSVADGVPARGKLDGGIMKKYSHGEFSGAGGKAPKEKLVNGLTNGLTTVFVDNPKLMDYLKDKIKEG